MQLLEEETKKMERFFILTGTSRYRNRIIWEICCRSRSGGGHTVSLPNSITLLGGRWAHWGMQAVLLSARHVCCLSLMRPLSRKRSAGWGAVLCCPIRRRWTNWRRDQRNTTGMRRDLENKICKELRELGLLSLEKTVELHTQKCLNAERKKMACAVCLWWIRWEILFPNFQQGRWRVDIRKNLAVQKL